MHGKQCDIALSSKSCSHFHCPPMLSSALPCRAALLPPRQTAGSIFRCGRAALGYFIAAVSPNMDVANAALPAYVTVLLFFVGLLLRPQDQPRYWHWFSYLDFLKYAWSAQMINQFESSHAIALDFQTVRARGDNPQRYPAHVCWTTSLASPVNNYAELPWGRARVAHTLVYLQCEALDRDSMHVCRPGSGACVSMCVDSTL